MLQLRVGRFDLAPGGVGVGLALLGVGLLLLQILFLDLELLVEDGQLADHLVVGLGCGGAVLGARSELLDARSH